MHKIIEMSGDMKTFVISYIIIPLSINILYNQ